MSMNEIDFGWKTQEPFTIGPRPFFRGGGVPVYPEDAKPFLAAVIEITRTAMESSILAGNLYDAELHAGLLRLSEQRWLASLCEL